MFLYRNMDMPTDYEYEAEPIAGGNYGEMDFGRQLGGVPDWVSLEEEPELLAPGAVRQGEGEFLQELPRDLFTDDATQRAINFNFDVNPTKVVDREYLLSDRSDLIRDAAALLQDTFHALQPVVLSSQPIFERIVVGEVQTDGHLREGEVTWSVEISAANQPGVHRSWQSTPIRKTRVTIPMKIVDGVLKEPSIFLLSSNRVYPLTIQGCQLALHWREKPISRKAPPKVERSWQEERDYRAF